QEGMEVLFAAAALVHIAELGCEIRAFTQYRVAADAVVLFPDQLAAHHRFSHLVLVGAFREMFFGMEGKGQEYQEEENASPELDVPGHALGKGFRHDGPCCYRWHHSRNGGFKPRLTAIKKQK